MRNRKHDIEKYLRGELSPAEMHALEREALSDPFLAEALEGVEQAGADNFLYDLHKLNRSVHDRMRRKGRKSKVIRMWGWTSAVAATVLLLIVSGALVVNLMKHQREQESALHKEEIPSADSTRKESDSVKSDQPVSPPLAALENAEKSDHTSREQRAQHKDKTPSVHAPAETAGEQGEVRSQEEVSATEELIASRRLSDDIERAKGEVATSTVEKKTQAQTTDQVQADEVARAIEGRVAGVETKQQAPSAPQRTAISEREELPSTVVRGKVKSQDGLGLPGVNVVLDGTSTGTLTDAEGNFQLAVPAEDTKLQFTFIGFESRVVEVKDDTELSIVLEEDVSELSEVVVTGYSGGTVSPDRETFRFAEPDGGRASFKNYLAGAVKYPQTAIENKVEGKVTVRFTVQPSGQLTDFEVVSGIGAGCDEELIRAIRHGPYWKPSARGNQPVSDKVKVRFKFDLPK